MRLGEEHPQWDRIQIVLIGSFLVAMVFDRWSLVSFGYSSILDRLLHLPELLAAAIFLFVSGIYLLKKSHDAVFGRVGTPELLDSGVYSLVRHPMYLGGLMIMLSFLLLNLSIIALVIWAAYALLCDWMATYEEKDLARKVGKEYEGYRESVPKWLPRLSRKSKMNKRG